MDKTIEKIYLELIDATIMYFIAALIKLSSSFIFRSTYKKKGNENKWNG